MAEWPERHSKPEMERLIEDRKNDIPPPQPQPSPGGADAAGVKNETYEKHLKRVAEREDRIQFIADRLDATQDRARDDFAKAKYQGMSKDAFDRSR